jgi:hypothetical protein
VNQDANRSRRDVRAYDVIGLGGAAVGVGGAILMWGRGMNDVSVIFLGLAALLLPVHLLLRRDAMRRDAAIGGVGLSQQSETAPFSDQRGADDQLGQIVVARPQGFYQDALRRYRILVDGQEAGGLKRGEELRRTVQAGPHDVVARIDWSGSPTTQIDVSPGGTVTLRVGPGSPLGGFFSSDKWLTLTVDR